MCHLPCTTWMHWRHSRRLCCDRSIQHNRSWEKLGYLCVGHNQPMNEQVQCLGEEGLDVLGLMEITTSVQCLPLLISSRSPSKGQATGCCTLRLAEPLPYGNFLQCVAEHDSQWKCINDLTCPNWLSSQNAGRPAQFTTMQHPAAIPAGLLKQDQEEGARMPNMIFGPVRKIQTIVLFLFYPEAAKVKTLVRRNHGLQTQ